MRLPFVSRDRYDETRRDLVAALERVEELTDTIIGMRREQHFDRPTPERKVAEPPDPERMAKRRLAAEWTESYVRSAVEAGASEADARVEAALMRDSLEYQQPETL